MKIVQILGLFNSGTNLLYKIVNTLFDVKIGDEGHTLFWKHTVLGNDFAKKHVKCGNKHVYLVVSKNPYFQFHSFKKAPYSIRLRNTAKINDVNVFVKKSFYILPPGKVVTDKYTLSFKHFPNYWNSFFDATIKYLPKQNTLYIKYEDIIFNIETVIDKLKELIPLKKEFINDDDLLKSTLISILETPAKNSGKPRFGSEALKYYDDSTIKNLYKATTFKWINSELSKRLMNKLNYSFHQ
jgi:hypothetical protein